MESLDCGIIMRVLSQKMNNRKINYSLLSKYGFNKTKE